VSTHEAMMACQGLFVLDFGQGMAGSLPGMILADNGAEVGCSPMSAMLAPIASSRLTSSCSSPTWFRSGLSVEISSGVRVNRSMCLRTADHYIESLRVHQSEVFPESPQAFPEKRQPRYQGR
jgi:hypothetical protein